MPHQVNLVGGFTVDAIIRADGGWTTGQLGGNALWAAMGVRVRSDATPAAHSVVGADYPADALAAIAALGVDLGGVRRDPTIPNARITYAYRGDGSRVQPAPADAVAALPDAVRPEFADTTGDPRVTMASLPDGGALRDRVASGSSWHLGLLPPGRFADLVTTLRGAGAGYLQADCPARSELRRDGEAVLREHLASVDVFLPSTSDTDVFAPGVERRALIERFHAFGAPVVVLKCGADGALVSASPDGPVWAVPPFDGAGAVDATGAGDVFCGAFAAAVIGGAELLDAAATASACASYALQVASPLDLLPPARDELAARIHQIRNGVTVL